MDIVKFHFTGTLADGKEFENSVSAASHWSFAGYAGHAFPCLSEGIGMMKVGGKAKLVCPSDIAYGDNGRPPIIPVVRRWSVKWNYWTWRLARRPARGPSGVHVQTRSEEIVFNKHHSYSIITIKGWTVNPPLDVFPLFSLPIKFVARMRAKYLFVILSINDFCVPSPSWFAAFVVQSSGLFLSKYIECFNP